MDNHGFEAQTSLDTQNLDNLLQGLTMLCGLHVCLLGEDGALLAGDAELGAGWKTARFDLPPDGASCQVDPRGRGIAAASISLQGSRAAVLVGRLDEGAGAGGDARLLASMDWLQHLVQAQVRKDQELDGLATEMLLRYEELNLLYEMGESIISDMPIDEIAAQMLERAVASTEAGGGVIALLDERAADGMQLVVQVARGWGSDLGLRGKRLRIGEGTIGQTIAQNRAQMLVSVRDEHLYGSTADPVELDSLLHVPLFTTARLVGAMVLVNKAQGSYFTASDEKLALAIATQMAIAIENNRLQRRIREEERIGANLQRYVSPNVVRAVLGRGGLQELIGDRWRATILFIDIRDFSGLVERTPPEIMVLLLNEYFREVTDVIFEYQGAIDEFAGDQLLAFFGIPFATPKGAEDACRAAIEIIRRVDELRASWQRRGLPAFDVGIGMNTGWVAVGNIGSEKRMELTVIGPPVVIASRVEGLNKEHGTRILITQETLDEVRDVVETRPLGQAELKGISRPIPVYEVIGLRQPAG